MKVKTSITLSRQVVQLIDQHSHDFRSRSAFMEHAARALLASLARTEAERRDLDIINRHADRLNAEAEDVLTYQAPL